MRISIIGSGNVATHLSAAFTNANHKIVQIWSRDIEHASLLAYHVKAEAINDISKLDPGVDIILIAVNDDAISGISAQLKLHGTLLAHTSGSMPMSVLSPASSNIGVFYPLQTFSKNKSVEFKNVPILIESNTPQGASQIRELAGSVSLKVTNIDSEKRLSLHVAAVFANNFTNYLFALSKEILDKNGLDFDLIRPLIAETASKVQELDPEKVQTGPAVRNDIETIQKHLVLLESLPQLKDIYKSLSQSIINFYHSA